MSVVVLTNAGIPAGSYRAVIKSVEEDQAQYGPIYVVEFETDEGAIRQYYSRRSDGKLTPGSRMGTMVIRLLKKELGDQLDPVKDLPGTECEIVITEKPGKDGQVYSRVENAFAVGDDEGLTTEDGKEEEQEGLAAEDGEGEEPVPF